MEELKIEHDNSADCPCRPKVDLVESDDGESVTPIIIHNRIMVDPN